MNLTIRHHRMNHEGHWQTVDGRVLSFESTNGETYGLSRLNEQEVADLNHFASEKPWTYDEWVTIEHTIEGYVSYDDDLGWTIDEVTIDGLDPSEWPDAWYEAAVEVLTDRYEQLTC